MSSFGIFLRGLMMGAADIVPGVSGGTVAFITGIYSRLLGSIRAFDLQCLKLVFQRDVKKAWQHVDGSFLTALLLGIATSILTLARLVSWLLEQYPMPLWASFFGLILASALVLLRQVKTWSVLRFLNLAVGVAIAVFIALSPLVAFDPTVAMIFLSGFLAICAMILPGISGSFILVLLGMYGTVLSALKSFDLLFILVFAIGAAAGLMCFSRVLHWLLSRFHESTMALLTGFLFGSLAVVWPWKQVLVWVEGSHGQLKPGQQVPVSPSEYLVLTGQDAQLALCIALMCLGFATVWFIDAKWGGDHSHS
ncbi:MAG: putative membrane protein [Bacteroidia bacterium]|jgi:putative membrane protein